MSDNEDKLKFYGLLKTAVELDAEVEYEAISDSLDVPVKLLRRWKTQYDKLDDSESVIELLDLDAMVLDEVAEHVAEKVSAEVSGPQMAVVNGKIVVIPEADTQVKKATDAKLKEFKKGVLGLQMLQEEVQGTAGTLISRIAVLAEDAELTARDLCSLTSALTSIQQAFFNKPTTNIQVNAIGGSSNGLLSSFREKLKP